MRIQHNIMSMNAYRNYNTNTSALSKNLEKLSSGYKINRAGDDAAGLAISEKMRAQITGLNAAQKNVKDGISLVKTAEGAMQEIQDMLNRMDYLATQSANGTYDDEVDRANLQKEVNALRTEIDRIADSANFNGIKLLDGSKDPSSKLNSEAAVTAAKKNVDTAKAELEAAQKEVDDVKKQIADVANLTEQRDLTRAEVEKYLGANSATHNDASVTADYGIYTMTQKTPAADGGLGFKVNLDGISHTIADSTDNTNVAITLTLSNGTNTVAITLTEQDLADFTGAVTGETVSTADIAAAIEDKILNAGGISITTTNATTTGSTAVTYNVTANNGVLEFEADSIPTTAVMADFKVTLSGMSENTVLGVKGAYSGFSVSVGGAANGTAATAGVLTATVTYTNANGVSQTVSVTCNVAVGANSQAIAKEIAKAINNNDELKPLFNATASNGEIILKNDIAGKGGTTAATGQVVATSLTVTTDAAITDVGGDGALATATTGADEYTIGTKGYADFGVQDVKINSADNKEQLASTGIDLKMMDLKDGTVITVGDKSVTLAIGADSKYKNVPGAIDLTKYEESDFVKTNTGNNPTATAASSQVIEAANKIAEALGGSTGNSLFVVGANNTGMITLKQKEEVKDSTPMTTYDDVVKHIKIGTTVAASDEAKDAETERLNNLLKEKQTAVDNKQDALDKTQETLEAVKKRGETAADGKDLQLQIGDTSDDYNQMKVRIGDMHTYAMFGAQRDSAGKVQTDADGNVIYDRAGSSINDIDISNQEGAAAAVQTIRDAINYVSSVRGDLGAVQNRLEHTANNLSVMAENIQDAESTIRDTDIAEEMMAYTKNNILVQSAQAMLAQANAVPQGVLQLLG